MARKARRSRSRKLAWLWLPAFAIAMVFGAASLAGDRKPVGEPGSAHVHADFKVYINGNQFDFSDPKYSVRDERIHLHSDNPDGGDVMHIEAANAPLYVFFGSLGMKLTRDCLVTDNGRSYCNGPGKSLRMFVNGRESLEFGDYAPKDLDRILITFGGSGAEIKRELAAVTDYACIHSQKCPGREIEDGSQFGPSISF